MRKCGKKTKNQVVFGQEARIFIALDYAKEVHLAQFYRADGQALLSKALTVWNGLSGVEYLEKRLLEQCRKDGVDISEVLLSVEDPPSYARGFLLHLRNRGVRMVRVNPAEAAKYRRNRRASSDEIDLDGIALAAILGKGRVQSAGCDLYGDLRALVIDQYKFGKMETRLKNQIHQLVDQLFPGFLSKSRSGLEPFGAASIFMLESGIFPERILAMRDRTLSEKLSRFGIRNIPGTTEKIRRLALDAPTLPEVQRDSLITLLNIRLKLLAELRTGLSSIENSCARLLAQSPCYCLASIPGVGIILASRVTAMLGDPARWPDDDHIASYAGIACRTKQTGGPAGPVRARTLPRDCNRLLKNAVCQAAILTAQYDHPWRDPAHPGTPHQLKRHFLRTEARGGHARISTARKLVRVFRSLVRWQAYYFPDGDTDALIQLPKDVYRQYYAATTAMLTRKWRKYDLSGIPPELNLLASDIALISDLVGTPIGWAAQSTTKESTTEENEPLVHNMDR